MATNDEFGLAGILKGVLGAYAQRKLREESLQNASLQQDTQRKANLQFQLEAIPKIASAKRAERQRDIEAGLEQQPLTPGEKRAEAARLLKDRLDLYRQYGLDASGRAPRTPAEDPDAALKLAARTVDLTSGLGEEHIGDLAALISAGQTPEDARDKTWVDAFQSTFIRDQDAQKKLQDVRGQTISPEEYNRIALTQDFQTMPMIPLSQNEGGGIPIEDLPAIVSQISGYSKPDAEDMTIAMKRIIDLFYNRTAAKKARERPLKHHRPTGFYDRQ